MAEMDQTDDLTKEKLLDEVKGLTISEDKSGHEDIKGCDEQSMIQSEIEFDPEHTPRDPLPLDKRTISGSSIFSDDGKEEEIQT